MEDRGGWGECVGEKSESGGEHQRLNHWTAVGQAAREQREGKGLFGGNRVDLDAQSHQPQRVEGMQRVR